MSSSAASDVSRFRFAVVLQTPRDEHSAVLLSYRSVAAELSARGHSLAIITPTDFPWLQRAGGRWTPVLYPLTVARWVRRRRSEIDAVVFHSYAGWWASVSGATRGLVAVVAFHGFEPMYHSELRREARRESALSLRYRLLQERFMPLALAIACRRANHVICFNAAERQEIVRRGWAPSNRVTVVAHGVPDSFLSLRRPLRPVQSLLFVGQWLPMKGRAYLAAAFNDLARRHADLHLVCAGTLVSADVVKASFAPEVQSRVGVLPRVNPDGLTDCYAGADLFLFPSLYEGFGRALLEAMAAALPIVTTEVGVAAEALIPDEHALFVPKRDAAAIVSAVERLLADQELCRRLSAAARERAFAYRERDWVREFADLLVRVASSGPRGRAEAESLGPTA